MYLVVLLHTWFSGSDHSDFQWDYRDLREFYSEVAGLPRLRTCRHKSGVSGTHTHPKTTTPPMPEWQPGFEIPTKHKEAIRQLYKYAKIGLQALSGYYRISSWTVSRVLRYDQLERKRPTRTGRPREPLNEQEVRDIIEYISDSHEHRVLNYIQLHDELKLKCSPKTLERRLKEVGYFRCTDC